jgi:hypothetical protein
MDIATGRNPRPPEVDKFAKASQPGESQKPLRTMQP